MFSWINDKTKNEKSGERKSTKRKIRVSLNKVNLMGAKRFLFGLFSIDKKGVKSAFKTFLLLHNLNFPILTVRWHVKVCFDKLHFIHFPLHLPLRWTKGRTSTFICSASSTKNNCNGTLRACMLGIKDKCSVSNQPLAWYFLSSLNLFRKLMKLNKWNFYPDLPKSSLLKWMLDTRGLETWV